MKKLLQAIILLLAINFLAVAGVVGWLFQSGHLDRARIDAVKLALFPAPEAEAPATQPAAPQGPVPPSQRLAELLAKHAVGRTAAEQLNFLQQTFDVSMAQLDRREREVGDRERQVELAAAKVADDRRALDADRQKLTADATQSDRLASDKGFQDTLNLYATMPSRQVKGIFMSMNDDGAVAQYLDAMEPRVAVRILKEFKAPNEVDRVKLILDKMRHPPSAMRPATP